MTLLKQLIGFIRSALGLVEPSNQTVPSTPATRGPKPPDSKPRNFGAFLIARIPPDDLGHFPTDEALAAYAERFGDTVRQVLNESTLGGWDRLAVYLPQHTAAKLRRTFSTPERMALLQSACERMLFTALDGGMAAGQRVYVINRDLDFHAAFDALLADSVVLRPLRTDEVLVTRDAEQSDHEVVQYLIGVLEISRTGSAPVKQLIWAYQVPGQRPRIRVNVDFDLLVKGFRREAGFYPLGLEINCVFRDQAGVRTIDEVSFDFGQALKWLDSVADLQYRLITGGAGGKAHAVDLRNYGANQSTMKLHAQSGPASLRYQLSPGVTLVYDRIQALEVGAEGRSVTYTFAFFPNAVSYDPRRNVLRLKAQCIPASGGDVFFAPGRQHRASPAFTLGPAGAGGGLRLRIPRLIDHTFVRKDRLGQETELQDGQELEVEIGDEITASPNAGGAPHIFRLQNLSDLPAEVKQARSARQYVVRVAIEAPTDRSFELSEEDHVFGSGGPFPEGSQAVIAPSALKFHREYLALKVMGKGIYYVAASAPVVGNTHARAAHMVPPEGIELALREDYDLYVGDLQFFLSLTATSTAEAMGSL